MKFSIRHILLSFLILINTSANAANEDDFFQKIWNNEKIMRSIDEESFTSGKGKYVFYVLDKRNSEGELIYGDVRPEVILYKIENGKRLLIFRHPAEGTYIFSESGDSGYEILTGNNSLYILHSGAHHGVWGTQYQFMERNGHLTLIGLKNYYATHLAYSLSPNQDVSDIDGLENIYGSSTNYLSKKHICWVYVGDCQESKSMCEINNKRLEKFLLPAKISSEKYSTLKKNYIFTLEDLVKNKSIEHEERNKCSFSEKELTGMARRFITNKSSYK